MWSNVGPRRHSAHSGRPVEVAVAFAIFVGCNALIQNGNTHILLVLVLVLCAPTAAAVNHLRMKQQFRRITRSSAAPRLEPSRRARRWELRVYGATDET